MNFSVTTMDSSFRRIAIISGLAVIGLAPLAKAADSAPTLTSISTLSGGTEDTSKTITYAALAAAANEADVDGDSISFRFKGLQSGTLKSGSSNVTNNSTLSTGESWVWRPEGNANGTIDAFEVRAYANSVESSSDVTVKVSVAAVDDDPFFTSGGEVTVLEDSGAYGADWASGISAGPADEAQDGLSFTITSNSRPALFSSQPSITSNGRLSFTPAEDQNGDTGSRKATIGVKLTDKGGNDSVVRTFDVMVTPQEDDPELDGEIIATNLSDAVVSGGDSAAAQKLFDSLSIADVDHNNPSEDKQVVKVTLSNEATALGNFEFPGSTATSGGLVHTLSSRTPSQAQAALRLATFTPFSNSFPVGASTFDATVEVSDSTSGTARTDSKSASITVESVNDAPQVTISTSPSTIPDSGTHSPFRLIVSDPDLGDSFRVTIRETSNPLRGTLSIPGGAIVGSGGDVATAIRNINYTPLTQGANQVATFEVSVSDVHSAGGTGAAVLQNVSLNISFTNAQPEIVGVSTALLRMTDDPGADPVYPFSTVTITDGNEGQELAVTLALNDASKGDFTGEFNSDGEITGTAAQVTAKLRQVEFRPRPNQIPVNESETITLIVSVDDGTSVRNNSLTKVEVTAVNGAPGILWNGGSFPTSFNPALIDPTGAISPFSGVTLTDDGEMLVVVALDNPAKGSLQNLGGFVEEEEGSRTYSYTGLEADVETALQGLEFVPNPAYLFPPNQPGRSDFIITASDAALNLTARVLPIVLKSDARSFIVNKTGDDVNEIGTLRHAISVASNNDVITFDLPSYPAVIRLKKDNGPLVLTKHLSFTGPGADMLTITGDSNANGSTDEGDVQLFKVFSNVRIRGVHLTRGFSTVGGAVSVDRLDPEAAAGGLVIEDCIVSECIAGQWGGGVDVAEGSLEVSRCLFLNNALASSSGLGGGAISLFTNEGCAILNSTFSSNTQAATTGYGGGAIYVENNTPNRLVLTTITHCTFAENNDAANKGSSIHNNVSNSRVILQNCLFGDDSARNLVVAGGAEMLSDGGNISSDNTSTILIQGGVPQLAVLLDQDSDQVNTDPKLGDLEAVEGQTFGYRPAADSPAIGMALEGVASVDQRGVARNASNDVGALDADALGKLIVHEIFASQEPTATQFIEFFNPRDQAAIDLNGYEIRVDGKVKHRFAGPLVINPGFGLILADQDILPGSAKTPEVLPFDKEGNPTTLDLRLRGRIEILAPSIVEPEIVASVSYVSAFADSSDPTMSLVLDDSSITLSPQFQGAAFIPHGMVRGLDGNPLTNQTSPGADAGLVEFGADNAPPVAIADQLELTEDDITVLDVLSNDLDADGSDELVIVDLRSGLSQPVPTSSQSTITTTGGAVVTLRPASPLERGTFLIFDPGKAYDSLSDGVRLSDSFAYSIVDVGGGLVSGYSEGGVDRTIVHAASHRLASGDLVRITDAGAASFNAEHEITVVDEGSFSIPVEFVEDLGPLEFGNWQAVEARSTGGTGRSQALVEISVLGRNDAPVPVGDLVATDEDRILRIFADSDHAGLGKSFDTDDRYPEPRGYAGIGVLVNDTDPDTDGSPYTQMGIVGVCQAEQIVGFNSHEGGAGVQVEAPNHGLINGERVLISGYGGHPSYNGYHQVAVIDDHHFSLPVDFVDAAEVKGLWTVLDDDNRLSTVSEHGATVELEIRSDRADSNLIYNPRSSKHLNGLANGEAEVDHFYYAVEDNHGAVSLGLVSVAVAGVNDAPIPVDDPGSIATLSSSALGGLTPTQFIAGSEVLHVVPATGQSGKVDAALKTIGDEDGGALVVAGLNWTNEDRTLEIVSSELLSNDDDVDRSDGLSVEIRRAQTRSREGALISIAGNGSVVRYDPTRSPSLQALANKERIVDTFEITVFDGIQRVDSLVAVLVEGRNDQPIASNANFATTEKELLELESPGLLLSGLEIDQDTRLPDNRKFLLPVNMGSTNVFGALAGVELESRNASIESVEAFPGGPGVTVITSTAHELESGEEVVLLESGELTGQFVIAKLDADRFSIPVPYQSEYAFLAGGSWRVLSSTFRYDPRASLVAEDESGSAFTLQGLAAGQSFTDEFVYTLLDGSSLFANDDVYRIEVNRSAIELRVLTNDSSLDGVATSRHLVAVGSPSAGGRVVINDGQSLIYTPPAAFVGDEVFSYTIEDDLGNRDSAQVTARVTVDRLNGNLRANEDRFSVAFGQQPLLDVLANDSLVPATGAPLTLVEVTESPSRGGSVEIEGGKLRYTPDLAAVAFPYTETFAYSMSGGGSVTASTLVSVLVFDRRDSLNVRDDSFSVPAGSSQVRLNVLGNDNVLPGSGDALEIISTSEPLHGVLEIVDGVSLSYTPAQGVLGSESFTYTVSDGLGGTGTAQVDVQIGYLTTNNDIFGVPFDDPSESDDDGVTVLDVLANDSVLHGGGGELMITAVTPENPSLGSMNRQSGGGVLLFDPAEGVSGQQEFVYTVMDAGGRSATGSVTVVVSNGGVRASSDFFSVQTGSEQNELMVLANDLPKPMSISGVGVGVDAPNQGGTVEISDDFNHLIYTPRDGFEGVESFTYTATDGESSSTARVSVRSTTGEMVAGDDSFLVYRGSAMNRLAVLSNDRVIPDAGRLLSISAIDPDAGNGGNPATRGLLEVIEEGGALSYTPAAENLTFPYEETFRYEISDGGVGRSEGFIRIEVIDRVGARDLETNPDVFAVRSDSSGTLLPVLANDSILPASASEWILTDVTRPTATACSPFLIGDFANPESLGARLSAQGDPLSQFLWARFSDDSKMLLVDDGSSDAERRGALVGELNQVVASGTSIHDATRFSGVVLREETEQLLDQGTSGEQLVVLNRLLLEDAFPDEIEPLIPAGVVQISGSKLLYAPQPGFVGEARFTYRVLDGLGGTGFAEVTVRVGDVSVSDDRFTVLAGGGAVALDLTANDGILRTAFPAAPEPDQADFVLTEARPIAVLPISAGIASVDDGKVIFTPNGAFAGIAELTYWVQDDSGCLFPGRASVDVKTPGDDRDSATVSIIVRGVNDAPFVVGSGPSGTLDTNEVAPFANATVIEVDDQGNQPVRLTIRYPLERGMLFGGFTEIAPGVFEYYGSASDATAALRSLRFSPEIDRVIVGQTEDTTLLLELDDDQVESPVVVDSGVVRVTPVNDAPVISGTLGGQKVYRFSELRPFAGVNITELDDGGLQGQQLRLTIDDVQKGVLSNLGGFAEQGEGTGIYIVNGTASEVAATLRALVFTPTPGARVTATQSELVMFTLSLDDGFAATVVDEKTSVEVLHAEVDRLLPLDGEGADDSQALAGFGSSSAVSGNTLVIGAPEWNSSDFDTGQVFVYERGAGVGEVWGQVAVLNAPDEEIGDHFGASVAIDGDVLVVGSPAADPDGKTGAGAVYVYVRDPLDSSGWLFDVKLTSPSPNTLGGDLFGAALCIQGQTLMVGAPNADIPGGPRVGRVFVFGSSGSGSWELTQSLTASDIRQSGTTTDHEAFGAALAIDGDVAIVGSHLANKGSTRAERDWGAAYVFTRMEPGESWLEERRLDEFDKIDGLAYSGFGYAVDVSGDRIVIGIHSIASPFGATRQGGARVYERDAGGESNWGLVSRINRVNLLPSETLGFSVAISGDLLMVGAPGPLGDSLLQSGSVGLYRREQSNPTWNFLQRYLRSESGSDARFGHSVAFDRYTGVIGVRDDSDNSNSAAGAGSAQVYQFQYDLGPRQTLQIADQVAMEGEAFGFTLDPSTFDDPIYPDELEIEVQLASGGALPDEGWLNFDPISGAFTGTPVDGNRSDYELVLIARNPLGSRIVSNSFIISVELGAARSLDEAYQAWAAARFSAAELADSSLEATLWGRAANPDGDSLVNELEMLFGSDPGESNASLVQVEHLSGSQLRVRFPISDEFPKEALHVEWSPDVVGWSRIGVAISLDDDGSGQTWVTAVVTPPAPQKRIFARISTGE